MLCLDTNVAIAVMNKSSAAVLARFNEAVTGETLYLPSVALFELRFGIANSVHVAENTTKLSVFLAFPMKVLPFGEADAEHAADIRADLKRKGTPIGPYDVLIAAQARCRGATLVTANTREFARVPGLALEDWTAATPPA